MSQILGREYRVVRRELTEEQIAERKRAIENGHDRKREIEGAHNEFRRWASPRIRRATDSGYAVPSELEGTPVLSIAEAHGLRVELQRRTRHKSATVAAIKAEIEANEHAAATGAEYRRVECELVADPEKVEVAYVCIETSEEVDRRGMTAEERQETLPHVERPKKKRNGKAEAPEAVQ